VTPPFIFLFFLLTSIGVATTLLAFRLKNKHPNGFTAPFAYFVLFFNIYGFVKLTGKVFLSVLGDPASDLFFTLILVLPVIYAPAVALYMFMLFRWIWDLAGKKPGPALLAVFWGLQAAAFGFYVVGIVLRSPFLDAARWLISMRDYILIPLLFSPLVYLFVRLRTIGDAPRKRLLLILGTYYLAGFSVFFFLTFARLPYYHSANAYFCLMTFFHYFLHLPPLLLLEKFLKTRGPALAAQIREKEKREMESVFAAYGITERERGIVQLIIQGKSNAEIGKELFIATKTVKNHVLNIYRKTGAKNRVQLTNLLRRL
jgi:DNA-binding CsgD family transcriptional regulator